MKRALVIIFAVLFVSVGFLYLRLDHFVKAGIETFGPRLTKTSIIVRRVSLSPFSGRGRIRGLEIGSPQGFREPRVFRLKDVRVRLEPKSILTDKVVVHELDVDGPELHYEVGPQGSNLTRLQKNIESYSPPSTEKANATKPKKIEIDKFTMRSGTVIADIFGVAATVPLPDITLENIGSGGGASMQDAAARILGSIISAVAKSVAGTSRDLGDQAKSVANSVAKTLKGLFK